MASARAPAATMRRTARVDSPLLPPSRRNSAPVRPGDAFFGRATAPAILANGFESGDTS